MASGFRGSRPTSSAPSGPLTAYMQVAGNAEDAQRVTHLGLKGTLRELSAGRKQSDRKPRLTREEAEHYSPAVGAALAGLAATARSGRERGWHTALGYESWPSTASTSCSTSKRGRPSCLP